MVAEVEDTPLSLLPQGEIAISRETWPSVLWNLTSSPVTRRFTLSHIGRLTCVLNGGRIPTPPSPGELVKLFSSFAKEALISTGLAQ